MSFGRVLNSIFDVFGAKRKRAASLTVSVSDLAVYCS